MCFIFLHLKTYICRHACHCDSSVSSVSSLYVAVPSSLMVFFILTGGCVLPKNCARSTSCCQAFTGTAGQYYYHAAFGFHESCQIKTLCCHVSVRVYFRKLCESDFGFWGFGILGDLQVAVRVVGARHSWSRALLQVPSQTLLVSLLAR